MTNSISVFGYSRQNGIATFGLMRTGDLIIIGVVGIRMLRNIVKSKIFRRSVKPILLRGSLMASMKGHD